MDEVTFDFLVLCSAFVITALILTIYGITKTRFAIHAKDNNVGTDVGGSE